MPDRAGAPFGIGAKLRLVARIIPRIPSLYRNRPGVVEQRISPVSSTPLPSHEGNSSIFFRKFITKLIEQKKYRKIGSVGYLYLHLCVLSYL